MTDDNTRHALQIATRLRAELEELERPEDKFAALALVTRHVMGTVAQALGCSRASITASFVLRLEDAPPGTDRQRAVDRIVRDFPGTAAVALVLVGGEHHGGSVTLTTSARGQESAARRHLSEALHALGRGVADGAMGGQVDLSDPEIHVH